MSFANKAGRQTNLAGPANAPEKKTTENTTTKKVLF